MDLGTADFPSYGRTYRITVIQHPERGAAFRTHLSRLPIAPPLIIQLDCWDKDDQLITPYDELPFLVCHITLQTPGGDDAQIVRIEGSRHNPLYGSCIAAPQDLEDERGDVGVYFIFPEVSLNILGHFRLKAYVMRITGGPALDTCYTESFTIVPETDYVAPEATELTRHFAGKGVQFSLSATEY